MASLLVVPAATLKVVSSSSVSTASPVEKVVKLLKDLHEKTEVDGKNEQKAYDKYACWCKKTDKRKSDAIAQAEDDLKSLEQQILAHKAHIALLTEQIAKLEKQMAELQHEMKEATNLRSIEHAAYQAESAEMKQAIAALEKAIKILHDGSSLLQGSATVSVGAARNAVSELLEKLPLNTKAEHIALLSTFAKSGYKPQSETIQGILKGMYDRMTSDLESATRTESISQSDFEDFMHIKSSELAAKTASRDAKAQEKAETEGLLADATQTYDNTEKQMNADIKFLDQTRKVCQERSDEWGVRRGLRADEIKGIEKALEILTSDEARTLFRTSMKPGTEKSFLQVRSTAGAGNAYQLLKESARRTHSVRLAALAATVRETKVGHFDKVIEAIDKMVTTLDEENDADIAKRDQCKSEFTKQASIISDLAWKIEKNVAKIDKLHRTINKRKDEKAATIQHRHETEDHLAEITQQRKEDHEAYLHAKDEDEQVVVLLTSAKDALTEYTKKNSIDMGPIQGSSAGVFAQEPTFERHEDRAPDLEFSDKGSRKTQTKGIVGLMTYLLEDAQNEIINDGKSEVKSVAQFEAAKKDAEDLIADLHQTEDDLKEQIARLQSDKSNEEEDKSDNEDVKASEEKYLRQIKPDCDWIIANFEGRAAARAAEREGLTGAKAALAGAV